jgi:pilin isopeptide linkage protein
MNHKGFLKRTLAALGVAALVAGMLPAAAFAAQGDKDPVDTALKPNAQITVGKTVTKKADATWPTKLENGFTFKLTPEEAIYNEAGEIPADKTNPVANADKALPMPGMGTGWTAPNTAAGETFGTQLVGGTGSGSEFENSGTGTPSTGEGDPGTTETQTKTMNIPNITFAKAGAYRYTLEEVPPADADKISGVTYDTTKYTVVVYVVNQTEEDANGNLVPTGAVTIKNITAWKEGAAPVQWGDLTVTDNNNTAATPGADTGKVGISTEADPDKLAYPFVNPYATSDLTVTKAVSGNLADTEQHFDFTVALTKLTPGQVYTVRFTDADDTDLPAEDGNHTTTTVTAETDGSGTFAAKLKHGERFTIIGLPVAATYTVSEAANDHIASYEPETGNVPATSEAGATTPTILDAGANTEKNKSLITPACYVDDSDDQINFSNERISPTLTGVIMQYLPFISIAVVAIAGIALMMVMRKKHTNTGAGRY